MVKPLVSIVMPTLNQGEFIEASIDSVLNQSYNNLELIVIDGKSSDETLEILSRRKEKDLRLKFISEKDNGPAQAINKGMLLTKGSILAWLNSDDLYGKNAISRAVDTFDDTNCVMVYGQGGLLNVQGQTIGSYPSKMPFEARIEDFSDGCFICQPTVFVKRTVPLLIGPLDDNLKTAFDFDYWFRVFKNFEYRIAFINELQAFSRVHDKSITSSMRKLVIIEGMQVVNRYLDVSTCHWLKTYWNEQQEKLGSSQEYAGFLEEFLTMLEACAEYILPLEYMNLKKEMSMRQHKLLKSGGYKLELL